MSTLVHYPLLDEDGSAVITHEHSDDHLTQPIGGAGGRIVCGVITSIRGGLR